MFPVISLLKKPNFLRIFRNFWEFLENLDISKKNFRAFGGEISERILDDFQELCS